MENKELYDQMQEAVKALRTTLEDHSRELKSYGEYSGETKSAVDKVNDRIDMLETKLSRPVVVETSEAGFSEGEKAFTTYMRKGERALTPEAVKALYTDQDDQGGFLVPVNRANRIIELLALISPVRQFANVETISIGNTLEIPREGGAGAADWGAGWVGERTSRSETATGSFGMEAIPTHEMYASPRISQRMLDDSAFSVEEWLARKVSTRFAMVEGAAFLNGTGVNQPEGLLVNTNIIQVHSGSATLLTADGVIALVYNLQEFYARNASFLLNRDSIRQIRQLKDTQNRYLWEPGLNGATNSSILGYGYHEAVDMPLVGAGNLAILFGDFASAYTIVDRQGINVLRDPFTFKPNVEFYTTKRVGGQVVKAEAMRAQLVAV